MFDMAVSWAGSHPLAFLAVLCGIAALVGAGFGIVPQVVEHTHDIHPRC